MSSTWSRYNKTKYFNSKSAYKWNSMSSVKDFGVSETASVWKSSIPTQRFSSGKLVNSPQKMAKSRHFKADGTNSSAIPKFSASGKSTILSRSPSSTKIVRAKADSTEHSFIRYDPKSRKLVKTIGCSPSTTTFSAPSVSSKSNISKHANNKTVVSRYKVVRNRNSASKSVRHERSPTKSTKFQCSRNQLISNYVMNAGKYRRVLRSVASSPRQRWSTCRFVRRDAISRHSGIENRYKLTRTLDDRSVSKNLFKIDRRYTSGSKIRQARRVSGQAAQVVPRRRPSLSFSGTRMRASGHKLRKRDCLFYLRYGRCCRGTSCQFVHDPAKVAVCTRFLRGTCKVEGCPFSHTVSPDKMPLCRFFLHGNCNRSDCPYLHVNHGSTAKICVDFQRGFCPKGAKCDKKHVSRAHQSKVTKSNSDKDEAGERVDKKSGLFHLLRREVPSMQSAKIEQEEGDCDPLKGPLPDFIPLQRSTP